MPKLYAALTDLPVVDDPAAQAEGLPRLPTLERLLARARRRPAPRDWRRWALGVAGVTAPAGDLPIARSLARAAEWADALTGEDTLFVATPVRLVAGLSQLHFDAAGPVPLAVSELEALAVRFHREWRDPLLEMRVLDGVLVLRVRGDLEVETHDPTPLAGRHVAEALPRGRDAGRVDRVMSELQMWLHNASPTSLDGRVVNGLWLWGAGRFDLVGAATWPRLETEDAFLRAVAAGLEPSVADARLACWTLAELQGEGHRFDEAERAWSGPLAAALAAGRVSAAWIHLGGYEYELRSWQRFRWWVRSRPWWELAA